MSYIAIVIQLLKKSPSSSGGGEIADSGQLSRTSLSVVRSGKSYQLIYVHFFLKYNLSAHISNNGLYNDNKIARHLDCA